MKDIRFCPKCGTPGFIVRSCMLFARTDRFELDLDHFIQFAGGNWVPGSCVRSPYLQFRILHTMPNGTPSSSFRTGFTVLAFQRADMGVCGSPQDEPDMADKPDKFFNLDILLVSSFLTRLTSCSISTHASRGRDPLYVEWSLPPIG